MTRTSVFDLDFGLANSQKLRANSWFPGLKADSLFLGVQFFPCLACGAGMAIGKKVSSFQSFKVSKTLKHCNPGTLKP
jgi:hypothetical protein